MNRHRNYLPRELGIYTLAALALLFQGCTATTGETRASSEAPAPDWLAFRFRSDSGAALNADAGWAAPENAMAELHYDRPFRFRIQTRAGAAPPEGHVLGLQYRWRGGAWKPVGVSDFPYPAFATPVLSVISTRAYANGAETQRLLGTPDTEWDDGAGLNAVSSTPVWRAGSDALEWEWPLVIRRFSDGPTFAEDGEVFELRVVDGNGQPVSGPRSASVRMTAIPGHLGGTFVETPGRLGPYQSGEGHLYFFIEPSETDNRFMAVRSTDHGRSWREVDGAGRPAAGDLEGVASARTGSTIHLIHQVSREVFYHAFEMGDPGRWVVDSQSIAQPAEPPTQAADLVARSDGSLVALYGGARRLFLQIRSPQGIWGDPVEIDSQVAPRLSGPVLAIGPHDMVTMAYTGRDGRGFIRHLLPDGSLTPRQEISSRLGTTAAENGAIAPLAVLPDSGTTVVIYREHDGMLHERRFSREGELSAPVRVSPLAVTTDAVDSEQVGADLVADGDTLHLLFIEARSGSLFHSRSDRAGVWSGPRPVVEGIEGAWVRGSVHRDASGNPVYGFVFDGGSKGGSGFNRYLALPLQPDSVATPRR